MNNLNSIKKYFRRYCFRIYILLLMMTFNYSVNNFFMNNNNYYVLYEVK